MRHFIQTIVFVFITVSAAFSQSLPPVDSGKISVSPIYHGSLVLGWEGKTIYIDPYGGADRFDCVPEADIVCITHAHGDHLNDETLAGLDLKNAQLVAPASVVEKIDTSAFGGVVTLANGESVTLLGIEIEAVPMYNLPDDETSRHKKGWGNGYVITLRDRRVYISGDTEDIPEMRALKDIDIAFVCMNLPYTMSVEQAAEAVIDFEPRNVYPYHYRGKDGMSDVGRFVELVQAARPDIDIVLLDWYAEK